MFDELVINKTISEDELILMIRKGNERAKELFFSYYEITLRKETKNFKNNYRLPIFSGDDIYQEIKLCFLDAINRYEFKSGIFYSFFLVVMKRELIRILTFESSEGYDSRKFETFNESISYDEDSIFSYKFKDVCDDEVEKFLMNDNMFATCVKLWLKGYTYKEIGDILNMSVPSVNYHIRKSIEKMKNVIEKKSD